MGYQAVALLHLDVRDGRPERDCRVAGDGEETGLIIQAAGRQEAALGVERQGRHGCGMHQLRRGERPRPDIPDPGEFAAGDRQVAAVGAVGQETYTPRKVDAGSPHRRVGKPATITSPSLRPTARALPSGLQAAAGTAGNPPGKGTDRSASRSQSVLRASLVSPSTTFFVIK